MLLFGLTLFLSACLLFTAELMYAKMVLPLLGGTPGVWTTCMLFFQAVLLAGYAYAHWSTSALNPRRQALVQIGIVLAAVLVLPIRIPSGWQPPQTSNPVLPLLWLMVVSVGLPFFAVSTTAPLLQRWFARTRHKAADDPYFLYAASNAGSLLGLAGYLVLVEPSLTLRDQRLAWTAAYVVLALGTTGCAWFMLKAHRPASGDAAQPAAPIPWLRQLKWLALAFVPSSLMLGVTTHATTDIAAVPLLWAVPLAIYLTTFIIAFSGCSIPWKGTSLQALGLLIVGLTLVLPKADLPMHWELGLHLLRFLAVALVCHQQLADDRPPVQHLTTFYLIMAVGGALGGVFNGLIAPMAFRSVAEYPLVLVLACVLCLQPFRRTKDVSAQALHPRRDVYRLAAFAGLALAVLAVRYVYDLHWHGLLIAVLFGLLVPACCLLLDRQPAFGAAITFVVLLAGVEMSDTVKPMYQGRSFFGIVRVVNDVERGMHELHHGTTLHGAQFRAPERRTAPTTYYLPQGPMGQALITLGRRHPDMRVAVVGLGAGALSAYAREGQSFVFYEIDPMVIRVAEDARYFTYLPDARKRGADVRTVTGDGRLTLARAHDASYDMIVLDAFSSDSVPTHLLTREALGVYLRKLRTGGVIVYNISNRYFDFEPLMAELAAAEGLACIVREDEARYPGAVAQGGTASEFALMARDKRILEPMWSDPRWHAARRKPGVRVWTDSYSNVLSLLKSRD